MKFMKGLACTLVALLALTQITACTDVNVVCDESFDECLKLAEDGNFKAQLKVAYKHTLGLGVEKNTLEAMKWFVKAAENGEAYEKVQLAKIYQYGGFNSDDYAPHFKVDVDLEKAEYWYKEGAKNKSYESDLADFYAYKEEAKKYQESHALAEAIMQAQASEKNYESCINLYLKNKKVESIDVDHAMQIHTYCETQFKKSFSAYQKKKEQAALQEKIDSGELFSDRDGIVTVRINSVTKGTAIQWKNSRYKDYYIQSYHDKGKELIYMEIDVTNNKYNGGMYVSHRKFALKSKNGDIFQAGPSLGGHLNDDVHKGRTISGAIVFEVYSDTVPSSLYYEPGLRNIDGWDIRAESKDFSNTF